MGTCAISEHSSSLSVVPFTQMPVLNVLQCPLNIIILQYDHVCVKY